jgi:hypothetical protein
MNRIDAVIVMSVREGGFCYLVVKKPILSIILAYQLKFRRLHLSFLWKAKGTVEISIQDLHNMIRNSLASFPTNKRRNFAETQASHFSLRFPGAIGLDGAPKILMPSAPL